MDLDPTEAATPNRLTTKLYIYLRIRTTEYSLANDY